MKMAAQFPTVWMCDILKQFPHEGHLGWYSSLSLKFWVKEAVVEVLFLVCEGSFVQQFC